MRQWVVMAWSLAALLGLGLGALILHVGPVWGLGILAATAILGLLIDRDEGAWVVFWGGLVLVWLYFVVLPARLAAGL